MLIYGMVKKEPGVKDRIDVLIKEFLFLFFVFFPFSTPVTSRKFVLFPFSEFVMESHPVASMCQCSCEAACWRMA